VHFVPLFTIQALIKLHRLSVSTSLDYRNKIHVPQAKMSFWKGKKKVEGNAAAQEAVKKGKCRQRRGEGKTYERLRDYIGE